MAARLPVFLSLLGLMLVWPAALSESSPREHTARAVSANNGLEQQRPRVVRSTIEHCGPDQQDFCFNNGQCMMLLDSNQQHCKCERGYYGSRCAHLDLVYQPMREEQLLLAGVCAVMLLIGLSGAFYFFYRWYRRNRCPRPQKKQGYLGVERV